MDALFHYFKKFNPLSKKAEKAIAEISSVVAIKKNKDLQPIGHTCKTIYFIKKGVARIYYFHASVAVFFHQPNKISSSKFSNIIKTQRLVKIQTQTA